MRLRVVRLDPDRHDRDAFCCGTAAVDNFLRSTAAQAAKYLKSQTFVLVPDDDARRILGFYALAQHGYRDGELLDATARALKVKGLKHIPMILLGQLGIEREFQGRGLGRLLLKDALQRCIGVAQEIGAVAVTTDPFDDAARDFYATFDFQILHEEPFRRMLLPMRTIAKAIGGGRSLFIAPARPSATDHAEGRSNVI